MRKTLAALSLACLLLPTAAQAHWHITRWGMTPEQVAAAFKGALRSDPGGPDDQVMGQDRKLSGPVSFEGRQYRAEFYFSAQGGLTLVRLAPADAAQCPAIIAELKSRHGQSANTYHGDWTD